MAKSSASKAAAPPSDTKSELVIITGLSGSGKGSVLKVLEDLGYYSVDNLPIDLIPKFAELTRDSETAKMAALVVDIREGESLKRFPAMYQKVRQNISTRLIFLEAADEAILRRFSETRRPHPLGTGRSIEKSITAERRQLAPIRALADLTINTSKFTVHELRDYINDKFRGEREESKIMVYISSFGFRHGVPPDSDLVFDVRFLPNPNYIAKFKPSHRPPSQRGALYSLLSANSRIHRAHFGSADLPASALHPGREKLSDDRLRLHGRTSPLRHDCGSDSEESRAGRIHNQSHSSRCDQNFMNLTITTVDAFTNKMFGGNPAAITVVPEPLSDALMQDLAMEMNLAETAFLEKRGGWQFRGCVGLRRLPKWISAAMRPSPAHISFGRQARCPNRKSLASTRRSGLLTAAKRGEWVELDFPATPVTETAAPADLLESFEFKATYIGKSKFDYFLEVTEAELRAAKPNFGRLAKVAGRGVIVT